MRIIVAAEHALLREGLRDLLRRWSDIEVVGTAPAAADAALMVSRVKPDILLLVRSGVPKSDAQAVESVRAHTGDCRVILVEAPARAGKGNDIGADGYVGGSVGFSGLVRLMWEVHTGGGGAAHDRAALWAPRGHDGEREPRQLLTRREYEVAQAVCQGLSNKEIGRRLRISEKTVKNHLSSIYRRIELTGRTELVAWALRRGAGGPEEDVPGEAKRSAVE